MELAQNLERLVSSRSEDIYRQLAGYGFARRFARGRSVVDIGWEGTGHASHLLSEAAGSVARVTGAVPEGEAADGRSPGTGYLETRLPDLAVPDGSFDVAVAFEVLELQESPEKLVEEAKRVLREDGVLLVSTPDKQVRANERNRRDPDHPNVFYVAELRELLERHFEYVHIYRQEAVSGGLVCGESSGLSGAEAESGELSLSEPVPGREPPPSGFVLAVCSDAGAGEEPPYLLLDGGRRVFEECEDRGEDVELLREEVERLQRTELQAFQSTLQVHTSEVQNLRAQLQESEARNKSLQRRLRDMEGSRIWQLSAPYRRLRVRLDTLRKKLRG